MADGGTIAGQARSVPEGEMPVGEGSLRAGHAPCGRRERAGVDGRRGFVLDRRVAGPGTRGRPLRPGPAAAGAALVAVAAGPPALAPAPGSQAQPLGPRPGRQSGGRQGHRPVYRPVQAQLPRLAAERSSSASVASALRNLTADKRDVDREEPLPGDSARGSGLREARTPAEARVARGELVEWMDRALAYLEDRDQQLLRLHYLDDLTFEQVAVRLNENAATLRQRAHRLLERLERGIPLLIWADRRRWAPIRSRAIGLLFLRAWSPPRVARELDIPEAAVRAWLLGLPVGLRDTPDLEATP